MMSTRKQLRIGRPRQKKMLAHGDGGERESTQEGAPESANTVPGQSEDAS